MKENNNDMTLAELSAATGVSPRTIRYYAQRNLLPPLSGRGRAARYGKEHIDALARIHAMQRSGACLRDVRRALTGELHHTVVEIDNGQRYAITIIPGIELHVERNRWAHITSPNGANETLHAFEDALRAIIENSNAVKYHHRNDDSTGAYDR